MSAAAMSRALGVKNKSYSAWKLRPASTRQLRFAALTVRVADIYRQRKGRYGAPRILNALAEEGLRTSKKRVARAMNALGLRARKKPRFKHASKDASAATKSKNLLARNFTASGPNQKWTTDITPIWTRAGWLHLAVVIDLFSRRVVGFQTSTKCDTALVLDALDAAVKKRAPGRGLLLHSDRGSQYTSDLYGERLAHYGMTRSLSRPRNCWDNAPTESFFSSLKHELEITGTSAKYATPKAGRAEVIEYIEGFYNSVRYHSTLGYLSPARYEDKATPRARAA
jgi:transposase InsO family protein